MPDAPETVNLVDQYGNAHAVPINQVPAAIAQGLRPESAEHTASRLGGEALQETYGGVGGHIEAGLAGAARGLTFGSSDIIGNAIGEGENLQHLQQENPTSSLVGEIVPQIAAAFVAPESLLARTPAGLAARAGTSIAELGEEGGLLARTGARVASGAFEGAAQQAGSYVSDVALGNKDLSAEGFASAMGQGALWGGVSAGALSTTSEGLVAARRLFPAQEMTQDAVRAAEGVARDEIGAAVEDGQQLRQAANDRLRQIRADHAAQDLDTKVKLDSIAVRRAQEVADAQVARAQAQTEQAQVKLERTKAGGRKVRKALQEETAPVPETTPQPEAVGASAAENTSTALERQLAAMKQGIDTGKSLSDLAAQRPKTIGLSPTHIEDGLNEEIAKINPEAAKLIQGVRELDDAGSALQDWLSKYQGGSVGKFERAQASRDWAEGIRPKEAGYYTRLASDSQTPGMTEGGIGAPRGRTSIFRGSEEERALADARTNMKVSPQERAAADVAVEEAFARRAGRSVGENIAEAAPSVPIDEQVQHAVRSKVSSIDDDVNQSAQAISRHEAATAELTDALGPAAPPRAQARAQAFREAQQKAEQATSEASARAGANAEKAAETIKLGIPPRQGLRGKLGQFGGGGIVKTAQDIGSGMEMLRMMGVDVPDPRNIPVIGRVLSAYLKARLLAKTFGRFGGKIAATAETTIASKAANSRQRILAAVDKMTEVGAKATNRASQVAGGPAAALGHTLFDDGETKAKPYTSEGKQSDLATMYLARSDEITRAMQPGAIEKAVRDRVKTDDPTILDAIVAAQERKLQFYDSKMPKPAEPPVPTQNRIPYVPSKADIAQWGRYVAAGEDPIGVIEAAANGQHVPIEAVETLKAVYPQLYAMAQTRILDKAMDQSAPMPYWRRVQLSILFDMPMDSSQTPQGASFLQQGYQAAPPAPQPQAPQQTPTLTADVRMSQRTDPTAKEI